LRAEIKENLSGASTISRGDGESERRGKSAQAKELLSLRALVAPPGGGSSWGSPLMGVEVFRKEQGRARIAGIVAKVDVRFLSGPHQEKIGGT